jgi:hypothetical protein
MPLLVHFRLGIDEPAMNAEDDMSAEIRAWYEDYQRKLQAEQAEQRAEERKEGLKTGERKILQRLLCARFGELPAAAVARIEAADVVELERWGERVLGAQTLADVFEEPS